MISYNSFFISEGRERWIAFKFRVVTSFLYFHVLKVTSKAEKAPNFSIKQIISSQGETVFLISSISFDVHPDKTNFPLIDAIQ